MPLIPPGARKHVLVTGGAGYIGSHTVLELLTNSYDVSVIDNLSNSDEESLRRVADLASTPENPTSIYFYQGDLGDSGLLDTIFREHDVWAVIHFAALKSAPESVQKPLEYYRVNVGGSVNLLEAMSRHRVTRLVFSSTAAVYGTPHAGVKFITEDHPTSPANPYGRTKLAVEHIISDVCVSDPEFGAVALRYFNPVGAHKSGVIGEDPKGAPGNLLPFVLQVASGQRGHLDVTGLDWPTKDGSGVRDFIHVVDLAKGHVAALALADQLALQGKGAQQSAPLGESKKASMNENSNSNIINDENNNNTAAPTPNENATIAGNITISANTDTPSQHKTTPTSGFRILNMGSGSGTSVLEMISTMQAVTGIPIPWKEAPRRPGDVPQVVANPLSANEILGWQATMTVQDMCADAWRWKSMNPGGYGVSAARALKQQGLRKWHSMGRLEGLGR
ncbi:hypothetical protein HK104_002315 [Borealophlyctis nickersoniae]|nr:hypothetical protein HK104_002315 [Borealophlyctis nickersoniae]